MSASPIAVMFDRVSPRYDALNHLLSFDLDKVWRRKTAKQVAKSQPTAILDLATGTGDLALALAKHIPQAHITGMDFSEKMLEIGRNKVNKKHLEKRISFQMGDAAQIPFPDSCFDAVTSAFGVRNFEHLDQGLSEMLRVVKTNGIIAILEFSHPVKGIIQLPYRCYSKHILPFVGRHVSKHPTAYQYLPESIESFPNRDRFVVLLKEIGMDMVEVRSFSGGIATLYYGKVQKSPVSLQ